MTSLTTTWSPNSFQLRLAFNCRKSPTVCVRMRVQKLDRQIRVLSVAGSSARIGHGVERHRTGNSWMNSNSSVDAFSGWSGGDGGEKSLDSQRKQWLRGIVGAGVAGVILVAGITFAALSISKRSSSRPAKEIEPLTTRQEVYLASDDQNDRVEEDENDRKNMTRDSTSLEIETGTDKDSSLYTENNEPTTESRLSEDTDVGYTLNGGDVNNDASTQDDLKNELAIDDMSVAPAESPGAPKLPETEIADGSFAASNFENSDSSLVAEKPESAIELKEDLLNAEFTNLSVSDANPTTLNTDYEEGVPGSRETENLNLSSRSISHDHSESLTFSVSVNSPLDSLLEHRIVHKESIETVNLHSTRENLDLSKTQEVSAEGNKSSLEEHNLNVGGSSGTTAVSAVAYPFSNEQDVNSYDDINGSRSFFESTNPWNSVSVGIPAPSVVSAALQVLPGKVLVPAVVDQVQGQALAALQVLKVIEADVQPGGLCTRREYARWLVSASSALSRSTVSKVYPAMYIENVTELAFDDITPEDPDFPSIQGLAEAGLISSKLSRHDMHCSLDEDQSSFCFYPESPLSRQDLVTWKIAIEKTLLPEADRKILHQLSGFIDIDKIHSDACPALVADLSAGEQGIIALAFGYTRLFQPDKPVTKAQAAIALATCEASDIVSEELARIEAESMAENAVAAHSALVAQVEKDVNASFEKELSIEREKIDAVEKLAEEARQELERLRTEREEDNIALMKERATVESEMEVLSRLRREVEEQLQSLMSNKVEISHDKERLSKLWKEAEIENQESARLQYELEVERKALSMTRAWAEDEAKRAREQAKALEEARYRWEKHGIKVIVDNDLREEANAGVTWLNAGKQFSVEGTVCRAENLVDKLKAMAADVRGKSRDTIDIIIQKILFLISILKEWVSKAGIRAAELKDAAASKVGGSLQEFQQSSAEFTLALKEGAKRVAGDCREGVDKFTQKFKT
uniref:Putative GPI-anchored adhesin-like protein PGA55 isoform X1 n=1 Tax=Davidia involucrata TaxID=16924 RepID=A0A5B7BY05_DAVIN